MHKNHTKDGDGQDSEVLFFSVRKKKVSAETKRRWILMKRTSGPYRNTLDMEKKRMRGCL